MASTEPSEATRTDSPIVLPGFDHDVQLQGQNFSDPAFVSKWMRRTFTIERDRGKQFTDIQCRYGNNITILFRACIRLRSYHESPAFWPAIALGFSCSAPAAQDMVKRFTHARHAYLSQWPNSGFSSATTKAADAWIDILSQQNTYRPQSKQDGDPRAVNIMAHNFYDDASTRFLQTDAANVLTRRGMDDVQRCRPRKRSPSPNIGPYRPVKRRPGTELFPGHEERLESSEPPTSTKASLPPKPSLALDVSTKKPEQVKQDYPTPSSTHVQSSEHSMPSPCLQPPTGEHFERKIRGLAQTQPDRRSSSRESGEVSNQSVVLQASDQDSVSAEVKKREPTNIQQEKNNSVPETTETAIVVLLKDKVASPEKQLHGVTTERETECKLAQSREAAYEARMKELEESRSAQAVMMSKMQAKLEILLQSQNERATRQDRSDTSVQNALETNQNEMKKAYERLTSLEDQVSSLREEVKDLLQDQSRARSRALSPIPTENVQRSMDDVIKKVKALPTMHTVSEKVFEIEQTLRGMLQEYQRNNDERVQETRKDLDTVRVQIRGLTKDFNKAMAYLPTKAKLTALEEQVARLHQDMSLESKDERNQLAILEARFEKQVAEIRDVNLAYLSSRLEETCNKRNNFEETMKTQTERLLKKEIAAIDTRIRILTQSFSDLLDKLSWEKSGEAL